MQVACDCEEGHGCPHSHVHTTTLRNTTDGHEIQLHGYVSHSDPQWLWVRENWSIRYWGDEVTVDTDDLAVLLTWADNEPNDDPALQRVIDKLQAKITELDRPTQEERQRAQ